MPFEVRGALRSHARHAEGQGRAHVCPHGSGSNTSLRPRLPAGLGLPSLLDPDTCPRAGYGAL